jgi:hypothetical protein
MIGTVERAADLVAVDVGEAEVEQDQVDGGRGEGRLARRHALGGVALAGQPLDQRLGDGIVILDQQDIHGGKACRVANGHVVFFAIALPSAVRWLGWWFLRWFP